MSFVISTLQDQLLKLQRHCSCQMSEQIGTFCKVSLCHDFSHKYQHRSTDRFVCQIAKSCCLRTPHKMCCRKWVCRSCTHKCTKEAVYYFGLALEMKNVTKVCFNLSLIFNFVMIAFRAQANSDNRLWTRLTISRRRPPTSPTSPLFRLQVITDN